MMRTTVNYAGNLLYDCNTTGAGLVVENITPCIRTTHEIQPPLGDGFFLKKGQLTKGSVALKVTYITSNSAADLGGELNGYSALLGDLSITGYGTFAGAVLSSVSNIETYPLKNGMNLLTTTLTFTLYP